VTSQAGPSSSKSAPASTQQYSYRKPEKQQDSWLAAYLKRSPTALNAFKTITGALGMGNPKQVAGRVTFHYYDKECATREAVDSAFWHDGE
jgi:cytochrome b pre-mRNA-processing protein 3